jgi:hypothetical protein
VISPDIDLKTVFAVCIGGILTLLGTLLSNYLQFRTEQRHLKKERFETRFAEVRRYLVLCLRFGDLIAKPPQGKFESVEWQVWTKEVLELVTEWRTLPVFGSARVLFVDDKEILANLQKMDSLWPGFLAYSEAKFTLSEPISPDVKQQLKSLCAEVGARLDAILDSV